MSLPIKTPAETVPISFDFSAESAAVSIPTVRIDVVTGADAAAADMALGAPVVAGAVVTQLIRQGVAGVNYALVCIASGADGTVLQADGLLPVRAYRSKMVA